MKKEEGEKGAHHIVEQVNNQASKESSQHLVNWIPSESTPKLNMQREDDRDKENDGHVTEEESGCSNLNLLFDVASNPHHQLLK